TGSRRARLLERAQFRLAVACPEAAAEDCRQLLRYLEKELDPGAPEIAVAQSILARACLDLHDWTQAEALAKEAAGILKEWGHSEAAGCLLTQIVAQWQISQEWSFNDAYEALRLIRESPLLGVSATVKELEAEASRLERFDLGQEAKSFRRAAQAQQRLIGLDYLVAPVASARAAV